jgi:hypothetical protein
MKLPEAIGGLLLAAFTIPPTLRDASEETDPPEAAWLT